MNIKPTLYVSTRIEDFRKKACPDLSDSQVLAGILNLLLEKAGLSFDEIMDSDVSDLVAYIRHHL